MIELHDLCVWVSLDAVMRFIKYHEREVVHRNVSSTETVHQNLWRHDQHHVFTARIRPVLKAQLVIC